MGITGIRPGLAFSGWRTSPRNAAPTLPVTAPDEVRFGGYRLNATRRGQIDALCKALGISTPASNTAYNLMNRALIAPSGASVRLRSNQQLEFMGDGVLTAVVRSYLVKRYNQQGEGKLTALCSILVCNRTLTMMAERMGLEPFLQYNREAPLHAQAREKMLADTVEALCGALFLANDGSTREVEKMMLPQLEKAIKQVPFRRLTGPGTDTATLARELWPLESDALDKAAAQKRKQQKKSGP